MKTIIITSILCFIFLFTSCGEKEVPTEPIKEAQALFDSGKFKEAKDRLLSEGGYEGDGNKQAKELLNKIKDTIVVISYNQMTANRNDEIYLDFKFGMTEKEVKGKEKELLVTKKILPENSYYLTIGQTRFNFTGSEVVFFLSDYKANGVLTFTYADDKLSRLKVSLMVNDAGKTSDELLVDIMKMYSEKYGVSQEIPDFFTKEEKEDIEYYYQESNKAIYIQETAGVISILYCDLITKYELDNLLELLEEIDDEINEEKASKQMNDI